MQWVRCRTSGKKNRISGINQLKQCLFTLKNLNLIEIKQIPMLYQRNTLQFSTIAVNFSCETKISKPCAEFKESLHNQYNHLYLYVFIKSKKLSWHYEKKRTTPAHVELGIFFHIHTIRVGGNFSSRLCRHQRLRLPVLTLEQAIVLEKCCARLLPNIEGLLNQ